MPPRKYGSEKTTTKEGKTSYMKSYMRDRRKTERAEAEKIKLEFVEKLLVSIYSSKDYEPTRVEHKIIKWRSVGGVIVTVKHKPSLEKRTVVLKDEGRITFNPPPKTWIPHITSVIERTKKRVVDKQSQKPFGTISLDESIVITDFRTYMKDDLSDLIAEEWNTRFQLFSERFESPVYQEKWRKMRKEQEASEQAFSNFVVEAIVDHKPDDQIIKEAKHNDATRSFFRYHGAYGFSEAWAKSIIKDVRRCLA